MFHAAHPVVGRLWNAVVSFPYHLKKAVSPNSNLSGGHAPEVFAALAGVSFFDHSGKFYAQNHFPANPPQTSATTGLMAFLYPPFIP
ncbi:hypothetical protein PAB18_004678 [Salmonella enterica]|uniref:Uncharacterized protein n=1 Tax=Salmonella enterica TaxID=28901 RepID=A0A627YS70_SALER|nr:hypothetical protein [Salmonella enterica]EDS8730215.1 hypothetical protein [Salmonella enterica subsp. enterica serovar Oranienburg]HCM1848757.1 hypothetical protein [Salmonella enterica subsp. diarizonae serovar 16:z10:e,n,x,z15]EGA9530396.1 hypothetical protein [Salmonella enterica]EIE5712020.1 hypothetical protein [Salmonella enterica]